MDDKFQKLNALGAGNFEHIDSNLIDHLKGTKELLLSWSASSVLQDAGLYHAAYGTAGFDESLVSTMQRDSISRIIGSEAEKIVYLYCACDRNYFWPQIGVKEFPEFKNRFTGKVCTLNERQLRDFCELTVANELEIAEGNPSFVRQYGASLNCIFSNMQPYLSSQASIYASALLGAKHA